MALPDYNEQFLQKVKIDEPVYNDATRYGVEIKSLSNLDVSSDAETYWRVVGVHHLTGRENMGNHHIYVDVLDEDGNRIRNARLVLRQSDRAPVFAVVDKPANEPGTNFPMWASTRATVAVEGDLPSEAVAGLRTDHADEEIGNTWGHHSFYIVFQRTLISEADTGNSEHEDDTEPGDSSSLTLKETIALVGQPLIIPLNPDAAFYKIAKQKDLGERLSREYDVDYQSKKYRAQVYEKGIVYAEIGDWGNVKIISRVN